MNELLPSSQAVERSLRESRENEQAAIDQVLALIYGQWRNLTTRLSPPCFVKLDREQLRDGPVGRDLQRLAAVARGELTADPEEISTAIESILQLLFWPAGARSYSVPESFWQTDLGIVLKRAKAHTVITSADSAVYEPDEAEMRDQSRMHEQVAGNGIGSVAQNG